MRSSNIQYLAPIDHLRAGAALLVLGYHSLHYMQSNVLKQNSWAHFDNPALLVLYEGYTGVTLFFVISGFLFTYGADGRVEFRVRDFWFNRFVRIYPMFFFVVLVAVTIGGSATDLKGLFMTLALLGNIQGAASLSDTPYTVPLWTIAVECQFYAVFPLLLWRYRKRGVRGLIELIAFVVGVRLFASYIGPVPDGYSSLLGRLDQFMLGMLAAVLYRRMVPGIALAAAGMVVALCALAMLLWHYNAIELMGSEPVTLSADDRRYRLFLPTIEGAIWTMILVSYLRLGSLLPGMVSNGLSWIGIRSYSMYLLNICAVAFCLYRGWYIASEDWLTAALSMLPVAAVVLIAISSVTFAMIEQPFMQLRRRYIIAMPESDPLHKLKAEKHAL